MASFCGNCGTVIPDGGIVCPTCGAPVANAADMYNQPQPKPTNNKKGFIIIGAAAAAVVLIVVLCIIIFAGGKSPEKIADSFMEAVFVEKDAGTMLDLMHDDIVEQTAKEQEMTVDELKEDGQEAFDEMFELIEGAEITWEVMETYDADRDELRDIREEYDDEYGLEVDEAVYVEVEVNAKMSMLGEEMDETNTSEIPVVKIDGKWYLALDAFDELL